MRRLEGPGKILNVYFDTRSGAIVTHLRALAEPRRQKVREYLNAIKDDLPAQVKWLTDFRGIDIAEIDFAAITDAFEYRRTLCGTAPSVHCFLHIKTKSMLSIGVMNQVASIAEAVIPNARAALTSNVADALSIVGVRNPPQQFLDVLNWSENSPVE